MSPEDAEEDVFMRVEHTLASKENRLRDTEKEGAGFYEVHIQTGS
jgi:hypothetical protein